MPVRMTFAWLLTAGLIASLTSLPSAAQSPFKMPEASI